MARERFSPAEFAIVIGVAFGYSILGSIGDLLAGRMPGEGGGARQFGDDHLYTLVIYELLLAPFLVGALYLGGWRLRDFKVTPSIPATVIGIVIFAGMWLGHWVFATVAQLVFPTLKSIYELWDAYRPSQQPTLLAILLVSVINPIFEEFFVCGYVIEALRGRFGTTTAVNVSVVIRASYHLYQGIAMQPYHIAYGLVQGYVYVRYGRLWPLLVSHALLDLVPLALFLI